MPAPDIKVEVNAVINETPSAYYILWDNSETKSWFPKSQCNYDEQAQIIYVPKWLYDKKVEEAVHGN